MFDVTYSPFCFDFQIGIVLLARFRRVDLQKLVGNEHVRNMGTTASIKLAQVT